MSLNRWQSTPWVLSLILFAGLALGAQEEVLLGPGALREKSKSLSGTFRLIKRGDHILLKLNDDFKAKSGPDLKVVLSPLTFAKADGDNAMGAGAVVVAPLKRNKGAQEYQLPADTDLTQFKSILIHCEKYAVLWGGAPLD